MQSRKASMTEALLNTASGFIVSMMVWQFVVAPLYNIPVTLGQNLGITSIFTVVSIARSYAWRRLFNWLTVRHFVKKGA